MFYLANSFSLQMLTEDQSLTVRKIDIQQVAAKLANQNYTPAIGHEDLAEIAGQMLKENNVLIPQTGLFNRCSITLKPGDELFVLQVVGQRLPIGCRQLPEGTQLQWFHIETSSLR